MNEVHLIGNLTKDCELNKSDAGVLYARFSIAVNKTFWKDNEKIEHTEFFNLVIFDRLAENLSPYSPTASFNKPALVRIIISSI